jgi:ADP-ribosylglycohydrolase
LRRGRDPCLGNRVYHDLPRQGHRQALSTAPVRERAAGAVVGALVGDALGVGPHWFYDLEEMRKTYGRWITGYTDPKPNRYHAGLKAGQFSQAGLILLMLLRSVVENRRYVEEDFCRRLDEELFSQLYGTPHSGPGGYTSQSIRNAWSQRVLEKKSWKETGGHADTTEAAERALVLAARYAKCPSRMAAVVRSNCVLTQSDEAIACMTTAYCCVLALLVQGETLDPLLSDKLLELAKVGELPFHVVTDEDLQPPKHGDPERLRSEHFSSPDALPTPPISRGRRSTLTSGSTPHGRCRSSTVCPARSIINFQPLIILQYVFPTISKMRF